MLNGMVKNMCPKRRRGCIQHSPTFFMKTGYPLGMVQILNNIPKLKQLSTNQKVSK
jgi:hypothetical protein